MLPLAIRVLGIGKKLWDSYSKGHKAKVLKIATEQAKKKPGGGQLTIPRKSDVDANVKSINSSVRKQVAIGGATLEGARQQAKNDKNK